jgi:hypothetical protein
MVNEIRLAGFTLTADDWSGLDAETRDELLGVWASTDDGDEDAQDVSGRKSDLVW